VKNKKEILNVSFSGGETSAYMTYRLLLEYSDKYDIRPVFANTGEENEETLKFIKLCDDEFEFNTVWVEAVTHAEHGKGQTHKLVNFKTASRNGEPFKQLISVEGIPNSKFMHCSERLKTFAINSYKRSIGIMGCKTSIGIRTDEASRRSQKSADKYNLVYPLLDWIPADKQDVNAFWEDLPFRLNLKPHQGNCKTCWKKSDQKLWLIALEEPSKFDFNIEMEKKYSGVKSGVVRVDMFGDRKIARKFFRKHRTAQQIIDQAQGMDIKTLQKMVAITDDRSSGCGETCEPYQMNIEELK